nr:LamG domain-containing protein [Streptomyces sp. NEAU-Y11]
MYFEFAPSKLVGKHVLDATFRAHETWSFDCRPHWVDLERTDNISEGTRWPGPRQLDQMGDRYVSAGRGTHCDPEQPDSWIEFNDDPDEPDENLKSTVRSFADGRISRLTLMLRAKDESDPTAWKRFEDNAVLKVTYVPRPGAPTSVGVIPGDGTTAYCRSKASDPLIATRKDPMVQARVQTRTQPRKGEDKGSLQAEFWMERKQDDGSWDKVWSDYRPDRGWDPDGTLEKQRTTERADGGLYRYRARTQSHWSYGGGSGDLFSPYSSWCYLKIDSTAPKAPRISGGSPYSSCTTDQCEGAGGPGVAGTFSFKPNTADRDITGYRWRLLTTTAANTKVTSGASATVKVTPSLSGTQVLSVQAKDVRNRWGTPAEFIFKVAPAEGAVGRWHFADGAPGSGVTTAADSATAGTRHDATLHDTAGTGWSTLSRRGDADYSLWLNDASGSAGYAATSSAAVNTKDAFTVSAWAYLSDASDNRVILSQEGEKGSAFTLYYSAAHKRWVFNRTDKDRSDPIYIRSLADTPNPPLHVWTHLAGVFDTQGDTDRKNDTIQLFVNGRAQGSPVVLSQAAPGYEPWTATRGLQFGRAKVDGVSGEYFKGRIDETAVWQRALSADELRQETQLLEDGEPAHELVAMWDASTAKGSEIADTTAYPVPAMKLSGAGASLSEDDNALVLDGTSGYAAAAGPVVDETGSFTVSTRVRVDGAKLAAKPVGYAAQVAGQRIGRESSWALWLVKLGDDTYRWRFTRSAVDGSGKLTDTAEVQAEEAPETDTWVQLSGTFDAQEAWEWTDPADPVTTETRHGRVHLYVNEFDQAAEDDSGFSSAQQGSGELAVGRGTSGGVTQHHLPGSLEEIRLWTGALTSAQIRRHVLDSDPLETS